MISPHYLTEGGQLGSWRAGQISTKPAKTEQNLHPGYIHIEFMSRYRDPQPQVVNKSTLDNSPPPNYDKESKDECHHVNNNARYKWYVKPAAFQVIAPTRSNYGRKINVKNRNKLTILIFLPAIIELVQELLISNMHNKLEEDTCENVEFIVPTRSNYWRKMRKIAINRPFWIFFQPLLNLSKNYLLVTCITNLKRICEKLFKLSRPQGQIIDVKWEKSQ